MCLPTTSGSTTGKHGTSHVGFRFPAGTLPVPAARPINPLYIRQFVAQVDDVRSREETK